ncbi:hypothetical protein [Amaricoccus solimangrovi]|uniref:Uncharacterized protein n=1 Tax=Amaricoccus solimangrovi TaxID=2589815 RepID=A0A501WZE3_9RHOB|nr:hypothetical protein [Amaricoccus solimangrovi]TPE53107.1 hypothetical protein FJM51_03535 [Amaricoccus solimangrovi]
MIRLRISAGRGLSAGAALLALGLVAGCQDQPAELGAAAPEQPQGGGAAATMGPDFCETTPTDPTLQNEWDRMCMPNR